MNACLDVSVVDAAERAYRRGLELAARHDWSNAALAFEIACQIKPDDAVFWVNLANAKAKIDMDEAIAASHRALELQPDSEPVQAIAAQTFALANRNVDVVKALQNRDFSKDKTAYLQYLLGYALFETHRSQLAIPQLLGAIAKDPRFYLAHYYLGHCLAEMRLHIEARTAFDTAMQFGAPQTDILCCKAYQSLLSCRWDLFNADFSMLKLEMAKVGPGATVSPFYAAGMPFNRTELKQIATANWERFWKKAEILPPAALPKPEKRPRVGFLSNDFVTHATAYLIVELLERIDRDKFDVYLYSYGPDDHSPIRKRIVDSCPGRFIDVDRLSDSQAARRIREDDIDILIDLKLFTKGSRLGIPAYRPAPVQVNFLGYPGTSGAPCYDYIIGDPVVTPFSESDCYTEAIAQMPGTYQPNDMGRRVTDTPSRESCGLPIDAFVFCCFNNTYKISESTFDLWCSILERVPRGVLWLFESNQQARKSLESAAQTRGIDPDRFVWAKFSPQEEHVARLANADLILDTLPYNAHTTASDALWAGVPLVTLKGSTFSGRVGASLLTAAGIPELIAENEAEFVELGTKLALDPQRLRSVRSAIVASKSSSLLFNSIKYVHAFEHLLEKMYLQLKTQGRPKAIEPLIG